MNLFKRIQNPVTGVISLVANTYPAMVVIDCYLPNPNATHGNQEPYNLKVCELMVKVEALFEAAYRVPEVSCEQPVLNNHAARETLEELKDDTIPYDPELDESTIARDLGLNEDSEPTHAPKFVAWDLGVNEALESTGLPLIEEQPRDFYNPLEAED